MDAEAERCFPFFDTVLCGRRCKDEFVTRADFLLICTVDLVPVVAGISSSITDIVVFFDPQHFSHEHNSDPTILKVSLEPVLSALGQVNLVGPFWLQRHNQSEISCSACDNYFTISSPHQPPQRRVAPIQSVTCAKGCSRSASRASLQTEHHHISCPLPRMPTATSTPSNSF